MEVARGWGRERSSSLLFPNFGLFSRGPCFLWCGTTSGTPHQDDDEYSLDDAFLFGRRLGYGRISEVRHALRRSDGESMAIKCVRRYHLSKEQEMNVLEEVAVLTQLSHPGIMKLAAFHERPDHFFLEMELLDGGELIETLAKGSSYTEGDARQIAAHLLGALAYAHSQGVIHRDICPENLLMVRAGPGAGGGSRVPVSSRERGQVAWGSRLKISGWGIAKRLSKGQMLPGEKFLQGSPGYMAPEVGRGEPYGHSADVWSLGAVLHLLLSGSRPEETFSNTSNAGGSRGKDLSESEAAYVTQGKGWKAVSKEAHALVLSMLAEDRSEGGSSGGGGKIWGWGRR
ncbi:unnamed protein product, partial [Discosporangium mesarthrocarpum]